MQCSTMLVKILVGHLGVHDKTDHTLEVRTLFCENALSMWDRHKLKGALKLSVFTPKA